MLRSGCSIDLTLSLSIGSLASMELVALQFTVTPLGGYGWVFVWCQGGSCLIPWFSSGQTVNNGNGVEAASGFGDGAH